MKYLKNSYFRSGTFSRSRSALCSRVIRTSSVLLLFLTIGVGQMWGNNTYTVVGVAADNVNDYDMNVNMQVCSNCNNGGAVSWNWNIDSDGKAGITFEGKKLYITAWTDYYDGTDWFYIKELNGESQIQYNTAHSSWQAVGNYNHKIWNFDESTEGGGEWFSALTMRKGHIYFDASGWSETDIKLTIGHAYYQRYYGMSTLSGTNLYYYHLNLNDAWTDAMGFGVVGNTSASDGANWLTNVSSKASEYTGYRHYALNNSGSDICYLIVNKGNKGENPDVSYDDSYTSLNSTQTFNTVVKEAGGSYTSANSKATISISSYELTGQGTTTHRTPSLATNESSETVSACRTAATRLQVGTVATGYQFDGWWTGATSGDLVSNSTDYTYYPTEATTLYARFSAKTYSISYLDQGGSSFSGTQADAPTSHTYGAATSLKIPTKAGYTFGGWYTASDCASGAIGTAASASLGATDYTANITLYAKWTINSHDITYTSPTNGSYTIKAGDASAVSTNVSSVNYATTITLTATPVNGCYVFDSWTVTGATSRETIAVTNNQFSMPDEDVTVTASFVQVNLALGITPVAGYTNDGNPNEVPDKLTDGNNTTAWTTWNSSSSVPASSEWFYVDLGAYYQLSSIEISWEDGGSDYYSTDYLLQVRQTEPTLAEAADDKSWYTAAEETGAVGGGVKRTTVDVPARYVRFHSLSRHGGWLRVWEFRVFGTATTTTYTTPTLNTAEVSSYPLDYETVNLHLASTDSKGAAIHTYKITDENSNVSIVTTNGSDLVTISGLSKFDTHTLTVQAMDNGALLSDSQNISVCIWDPSYNMAQGKTVVAGYTNADNTGEAPSKLTDGDTGTMWTTYLNGGSVPASDEWFYVDLGAYYQLSSIELLWGDVYSTDYLLQVRQDAPADDSVQADDMQWYPVAEVSDATASSTKSTAVNIPARYVRFHSKTRSGGWLRVCEIRVYTSSFASADANVPVVATATTSYNNDGKAYLTLTATDTEDVTTNWFRIYNPSTETYSLQQTNASNQIVIDDLPSCAAYTFEVQAMDKAAKLSEVSEIEVKVPVSSLVNLALGKTTYAGYSENGDGSKANAIDGDTGTKWSANGATADKNEWFAVDLGKRYDIGKIKLLFGGSGNGDNAAVTPRDFTIQTSLDNVNWADVHHYDSQPTINEWVEKNISKTWAARYVRIWVKEHTTYGMHILELEVYSKYGCYEDDGLIIYHKDDKADDVHADGYEPDGFAGGKIDGIIEYRMKVRAKDQWHALCLPFTVTAVQVWDEEDKMYYDLIPYYRSEGKYYKGHYIIRKPERKLNLPLENFGNWVDPSYQVGFLPQKDTVYIIQWHEDYYVGRYISFFGASGQTIPTSMSVGDAPTIDKVVNLYGNNAMVSGEVTDAYTLVGDYGGGAWLRNDEVGSAREVLPFECYIRANSGTTTIFNAIRRDMTFIDTPTRWDDVVNAEINRHVRVYSITGEMMEQFSDCSINEAAERVRSAYGEGLYILNTENECVKLLVGGK